MLLIILVYKHEKKELKMHLGIQQGVTGQQSRRYSILRTPDQFQSGFQPQYKPKAVNFGKGLDPQAWFIIETLGFWACIAACISIIMLKVNNKDKVGAKKVTKEKIFLAETRKNGKPVVLSEYKKLKKGGFRSVLDKYIELIKDGFCRVCKKHL